MLKIERKDQTCNVSSRNRLDNDSLQRVLDIVGQECGTCYPVEQRFSLVSLPNWEQMQENLAYQIDADQKRALGIMYTRRNTFR